MGLSPAHHAELNKLGASDERLAQLRHQYANDPVALQQIDGYDNTSPYLAQFAQYLRALKTGDRDAEAEAEAWVKEHYPDI